MHRTFIIDTGEARILIEIAGAPESLHVIPLQFNPSAASSSVPLIECVLKKYIKFGAS